MGTLNPVVSIIIPVYNGANYLREAIDSALAQTYPDVEVIVINDGSNDAGKTREVALSFGNRIRYLEKANGGVATALNLGIREMRGEFFSWLSHDDVYYPDKISRQVAYLKALDEDKTILFSNYDVIDHASRVIGTGVIENFALDNSILSIVGTYVNGCSMLIPKSAFEAAGFFNESLKNSQDNELWLRMAMKGYRLRYMPDTLIKSRKHAGQGSLIDSARHSQEARAFYLWALTFVGEQYRVENAAGLFRILLMKRLPSQASRFLWMLRKDRSFYFALSSVNKGAMGLARPAIMRRLAALPGLGQLIEIARQRRFRNSAHYWEQRYRLGETSGVGSYGRYAEYKTAVLNQFVAAHGIRKVADFGCGDGNQLKSLRCAEYLGLDVSRAAVDRCRAMYRDDGTKNFLVYNGPEAIAKVKEFEPELTMSLDVIYHLTEETTFEEYMDILFGASSRYVVIFSTNFDRRYDSPHQVDREFTKYIAKHIRGWKPLEALTNPHKGPDTQSDFYIYEKAGEGPG